MINKRKNTYRDLIKKYWKKVLIYAGIVLATLFSLVVITIAVLRAGAKRELFNNETFWIQGNASEHEKDSPEVVQYKGKSYAYKQGIINILLLGVDDTHPMSEEICPGDLGQSDAIYLMSIDTVHNTMKLLGIPRETMLPVQVYDQNNQYYNLQTMQLALQFAYGNNAEKGSRLAAKAVSSLLYDIPIQRVIAVNMMTITLLNDAIGGVEVNINEDNYAMEALSTVTDQELLNQETIKLKGKQALHYVRDRDCTVFASSMGRLERQEQYVDSFMSTLKNQVKRNPILPIQIFNKIKKQDYIFTDLNLKENVYLLSELLKIHVSADNIVTIAGEVKTGEQFEEFYPDTEKMRDTVMQIFYHPLY